MNVVSESDIIDKFSENQKNKLLLKVQSIKFYQFSTGDKTISQADGAIGEPSDKSDFSLLVWDSFSQEIRDLLFIFYGQKSFIYLKCSDFLPKKEEMCYFFIEKREKQNKRRKLS